MHTVAKQKRSSGNSQPIIGHPLFSPVVALWFGALFGLGSLAVRPALLEALVLKTHLDLVVPAATPPLGVTARMLVALTMAAFGAVLGVMLARRLARPKPVVRERKRNSRSAAQSLRSGDSHPDAPPRRPISAYEELGGEVPGPGALANRRRALALDEAGEPFVPHDLAPLPGGAVPQVLDLAEAIFAEAPADETVADNVPASVDEVGIAAAFAPQPQEFCPISAPDPDQRQVFGMAPPAEPVPDKPRQIFGVTVEGDHLPEDFVKAAGFRTSVFDTATASPLFPQRESAVAEPGEQDPPDAIGVPTEEPAVAASVAPPTATPVPPTELAMTDLAARLGDAMRRRRAARQADTEPKPAAIAPLGEAIPMAMRPLDLGECPDEGGPLDSLLPPRLPVIDTAPEQAEDDPAEAEPAAPSGEGAYGSLLEMAPAAPFVRVEEPEGESAAAVPEPVVIFPGQNPRSSGPTMPFRAFDAPSSAGQGAPIAASQTGPAIDPGEAERALRSALANLQRISGAG